MDDANTDKGRATNIIAASTIIEPQPTSTTDCKFSRVASSMNKPEISRTLKVSLNSRMSSTSTSFILANTMPEMVTAKRPDSCAT